MSDQSSEVTKSGEWRWLWREMRPFVLWQASDLVCIISATAIGLSQPLLLKWLIDDVLPTRNWTGLATIAALLLITGVSRSLLSALGSLLNTVAVKRMTFHTRARLSTHLGSLSADFHGKHSVGDLLERLERDVALVGELGSNILPTIVRVAVEASLAVALMLYLDWRLTAIVVPMVVLFAYVRHRYRSILQRSAEAAREASGRQSGFLQEMLTGAIQIQLLGAEQRMKRRYRRLGLQTLQHEIQQRRDELVFIVASMSVISLGTALVIGYGGAQVILAGLTVGSLVAFYGYVGSIFSPMSTAVRLYAALMRVHASVRRLIEVDKMHELICEQPDAPTIQAPPRRLVCDHVSFGYGGTTTLKRVRFEASAGERIAVVGASGSGKSSLLKLFPRLHDVGDGRVELDGHDIRSLRLSSLRRVISFVPQEPVLFRGTIRDNVRLGCPTATQKELDEVAWTACVTEVIQRLPLGWDTELGPMGGGLSGGEKQRLAIARALLQKRPILVLDEATSALDSATERRLLTRLESHIADRMVILVTHRRATAEWADRVIHLSHGELVEEGDSQELAEDDTPYVAFWEVDDDDLKAVPAKAR